MDRLFHEEDRTTAGHPGHDVLRSLENEIPAEVGEYDEGGP
jgi:hypothetical protein